VVSRGPSAVYRPAAAAAAAASAVLAVIDSFVCTARHHRRVTAAGSSVLLSAPHVNHGNIAPFNIHMQCSYLLPPKSLYGVGIRRTVYNKQDSV